MSLLCILEINPLSVVSFAVIFSHSEGGLFTLFIVFFTVQKLFSLIRSHLFIFLCITLGGESHGQRSLVGCSPWGRWESDMTGQLHFHFSLSCIGEGNGNPLQCSCLENPRDGGAWWAAVYGAAQSRTRLKRLSSSRRWVIVDLAVI